MTKKSFRAWRAELNVTQAEAARFLCAGRSDVSRWESESPGMPTPSLRIELLCWLMKFPAIKKQIEVFAEAHNTQRP